jgi:hypothetical protein
LRVVPGEQRSLTSAFLFSGDGFPKEALTRCSW